MRRMFLIAIAAVVVFGAGIATARAQLVIRHELLPSTAIYTSDGNDVDGAKVMYLRDNENPETCTQIILVGGVPAFAVPAHKDSCAI